MRVQASRQICIWASMAFFWIRGLTRPERVQWRTVVRISTLGIAFGKNQCSEFGRHRFVHGFLWQCSCIESSGRSRRPNGGSVSGEELRVSGNALGSELFRC